MPISRKQEDRIAIIVFAMLCVAAVGIVAVVYWAMFRGAFTSPRDVRIVYPDDAVREARALIGDRAKHPEKYDLYTEPGALPKSLQLAGLRYAKVHADHIDLVIARNPDWDVGARIWSAQHRPHRDRPTRYRDVYFFRYTHESPETLENIR